MTSLSTSTTKGPGRLRLLRLPAAARFAALFTEMTLLARQELAQARTDASDVVRASRLQLARHYGALARGYYQSLTESAA